MTRTVLKALGAALVAIALAVLPFMVWLSNQWAIVSATAGLLGCVLLGIAFAGNRDPG
jgi:hypothetical protein